MPQYIYEDSFFNYVDRSSSLSAKKFITLFNCGIQMKSLLDIGCGRGAWLSQWEKSGIIDFYGVDGDYVEKKSLLIHHEKFGSHDISKPFDLGRKFDLVECLEVAEHIDEKDSKTLLENIIRHGDVILFSAAIPGQGGEFHINEQPLRYWADKFHSLGYRCFDCVRSKILKEDEIEPWYRYNVLLYVNNEIADNLPQEILSTEVNRGSNIKELYPISWKIRNSILKKLPKGMISYMAKIKHLIYTKIHRYDKF